MKITFLGTGTSQGVPVIACNCKVCRSHDKHDKRLRTSLLIERDQTNIVIDAGPDFREQMLREKVTSLDAILLTHEHYDHISGLDDIRAYNWVQNKPMAIYADDRVITRIKVVFSYVFADTKYPGIPRMQLTSIGNAPFIIGNTQIDPIDGLHADLPVKGFRFDNFAYLTDFKIISEQEKSKLENLDVLVVNALRQKEHHSHFTLREAIDLIQELKPKQAYITHISHQMGLHADFVDELPHNIAFAYDGLSFDL